LSNLLVVVSKWRLLAPQQNFHNLPPLPSLVLESAPQGQKLTNTAVLQVDIYRNMRIIVVIRTYLYKDSYLQV
jgi:hypothetical protein